MHPRPSLCSASLLVAAAVTVAVALPISPSAASEHRYRGHVAEAVRSEERAARAEERAARAEERAARATERRAARARERAARKQERAARRGPTSGQPTESSPDAGEAGVNSPLPESSTGPTSNASGKCQVNIDASSHRITAGETVSISGKLTCPSGANAAAQQVAVDERESGAGPSGFTAAGTVTTQADGSFKLTPPAFDTNKIFRIREGSHGAHTVVRVAPLITISGPAPGTQASAVGGRLHAKRARARFTGTVSPIDTGALVALQVAHVTANEQWRTVALGRVASDGTYSVAHIFRTPGPMNVRTIVHTSKRNVPAVSEPLPYTAVQPQNPQLTIEISAGPISFGQTVTISGVAAGAANGPVTLLASTRGSAFSTVATATTDAKGNYTFTQATPENTYYRVTDATTRSTTLFEGVEFALAAGAAPDTTQAEQELTFSGTLAPAHAGQIVRLERENASGIGFHVVDVGTVDAASSYTITHTFAAAGTAVLRIKIPGDGQHQSAASTPFSVSVTSARLVSQGPEQPADAHV
jgi:hypothetical protein